MSNSYDNKLGNLKPYIIAIMQEEGRDFMVCEYCDSDIVNNRYEIHHTKYKDATYYDLMIVCTSCNKIPENVGLM